MKCLHSLLISISFISENDLFLENVMSFELLCDKVPEEDVQKRKDAAAKELRMSPNIYFLFNSMLFVSLKYCKV